MGEKISFKMKPHGDVELKTDRSEIDVYLTLPDNGVVSDTGVMLYINGFGWQAHNEYNMNTLYPLLANKFNCIVGAANYFGIFRGQSLELPESFYNNLNTIYGLGLRDYSFKDVKDANELYLKVASMLVKKGVMNMDVRCQPRLVTGRGEYQSWGFLPAVDHLCLLGEILRRYDADRRKIIACGSGYGGYVAMLLGKFAPRTFSSIIDIGGHTKTVLKHVVGSELQEIDYTLNIPIENSPISFVFPLTCNNPWTIDDEESAFYFSDACRQIRNLAFNSHRIASDTRYHIFHSMEDQETSIQDKDRLADFLVGYNTVYYKKVGLDDIAKGPFKDLSQGFGCTAGEILEYAEVQDANRFEKADPDTDFNRNSSYEFVCDGCSYNFDYNTDDGVKITICRQR